MTKSAKRMSRRAKESEYMNRFMAELQSERDSLKEEWKREFQMALQVQQEADAYKLDGDEEPSSLLNDGKTQHTCSIFILDILSFAGHLFTNFLDPPRSGAKANVQDTSTHATCGNNISYTSGMDESETIHTTRDNHSYSSCSHHVRSNVVLY